MKNLSSTSVIILLVFAGVLGFLFGQKFSFKNIKVADIFISQVPPNTQLTPTETQQQDTSTILIEEELYTIRLPEDWHKGQNSVRKGSSVISYANNDNDFFEVELDPLGRGFAADLTWHYAPNNDKTRLTIVKEIPCDNPDSPFCGVGDGRLDIGIKTAEGIPYEPIKSHHYFFTAGNSKQDKKDTEIYKRILESIVFK